MPNFKLTEHARQRIYERSIEPYWRLELKIAKGKVKKHIAKLCRKSGYDKNNVYWVTEKYPIQVFVTRKVNENNYLVLTAFRLYSMPS
jgi:predicted GNAT superfamily acetyltransferase